MIIKKLLFLVFFIGFSSSFSIAQEAAVPAPIDAKLIITSNLLSFLGGNTSVNLSLEKPLTHNRGIELDFDYYFDYYKEVKDRPINYLNTETKNGFSVLASYKFLVGDSRGVQFFYGPTIGYRSISYNHEYGVCTEVAEEVPISSICECLNLEQNLFTSQSRSAIFAANVGFQTNYNIRQGGQFFIKIHAITGVAQFFPKVERRLETVICPMTENLLSGEEGKIIRFGQRVYTNHTVQFSNNLKTYLSLNVKLGYAF